MRGNRFAYNGIGIMFNSETGGNNMVDNIFEGNLTQVSYGGRGDNNNSARNTWTGNFWDDTRGFDRTAMASGTTHELLPTPTRSGSDARRPFLPAVRRSWNCSISLERLAPFSKPT